MHPTRNDLSEQSRSMVCELLNQRLVDLIDLGLQAKQAHWNVKGSSFLSLHELFDQVAGVLPEMIDEVAERIVALGGTADGTVTTVAAKTSLPGYPVDISCGKEHTTKLANAIAEVAQRVRASIGQAGDAADEGTADLLTGISRELDKQLWFVESHLQGG